VTPRAGRALQAVGIAFGALILGMIIHKGYSDISLLADQHSGWEFWEALARYFIGNLAGGGKLPPPAQ
jgi:hypothetical protein